MYLGMAYIGNAQAWSLNDILPGRSHKLGHLDFTCVQEQFPPLPQDYINMPFTTILKTAGCRKRAS
ncbi:Uncharacterised protein [Neisseria zoodegmatis]|uniref:Uncharacterized protein n=1 Tax=Neisseria zoodegmatis TaxID=326523 RepID=A0A378WT60_9NEIS|nr:Uncharacterised protein [Neisseria zoodegmatis]